VAFFQFLDCCARTAGQLPVLTHAQSSVFDTPHLAQLVANGSARIGTKGLADLLSSPAATAALGAALCSIVKLTAVYAAGEAGAAAAAAAVGENLAIITGQTGSRNGGVPVTRLFAAVEMLPLLQQLSSVLMAAVRHTMQTHSTPAAAAAAASSSSSSSSSSGSRGEQARASSIFLMVLLCQRLLALHDAAAGIAGMPSAGLSRDTADEPAAGEVNSVADNLMCNFMADALAVFAPLPALQMCFWVEGAAAAGADGAGAAQTAAPITLGLRSNSSSSSSSSRPVCWQHLLRLHESRKLMGAVAAFGEKWRPGTLMPVWLAKAFADGLGSRVSSEQQVKLRQMYQDAMDFCRALVAVAPLPVVCNNPQCKALHRVSEGAAAHYVCAGCGCRYRSAACQAAGWRSHKKACRRMAACGLKD
jgi:hypothetical protein